MRARAFVCILGYVGQLGCVGCTMGSTSGAIPEGNSPAGARVLTYEDLRFECEQVASTLCELEAVLEANRRCFDAAKEMEVEGGENAEMRRKVGRAIFDVRFLVIGEVQRVAADCLRLQAAMDGPPKDVPNR